MRRFLFATVFALTADQATAQTTDDELLTLAYEGNYEALEVAFAGAHQQSLTGDISFDHLRDMVISLTVTHPTILETTDQWIAAFPESPYANALRAFQLSSIAWGIRGELTAHETPQDALHFFAHFHANAMDHALQAYESGPDYVPASDAVFRIQNITKFFERSEYLSIVDDVLTTTPNIGSLLRSADFAKTGWGGRGQSDIRLLCEEYAPLIPDESYTTDICVIHLGGRWTHATIQIDALRRLDGAQHDALEPVQAWYLTAGHDPQRPDTDLAIVENYLTTTGSQDHTIAFRYMRSYPRTERMDAVVLDVVRAAKRQARDLIRHDPFDPNLIQILLGQYPIFSLVDYDFERDNRDQSEPILKQRMAVARPFHADTWQDAAWDIKGSEDDILELQAEPYYINAVYYADHNIAALQDLLFYRHEAHFVASVVNGFDEATAEADLDAFHTKWTCPLVRLSRMVDHQCRQQGLGPAQCPEIMMQRREYKTVVEDAKTQGLCVAEFQSNFADLAFSPVQVNLERLSQPLIFDE